MQAAVGTITSNDKQGGAWQHAFDGSYWNGENVSGRDG